MEFAIAYAAAAAALILVATYYLLASIPFSYYHFLQFPHFWWLPLFIAAHPLVFAAGTAALLPRGCSTPPALKPWIRRVAAAAAAAAFCMAALELAPAALSYELAAVLTFVPLLTVIAAGVLGIAASGGARGFSHPAPHPGRAIAAGAGAGLLVGAANAAAGAARGALALGSREFMAAAGVSIALHVVLFASAALTIAIARRTAERRGVPRAIEQLAVAVIASAAGAALIRRSILTALILSDLRAALVAVALAAAIAVSVWAVAARRGGDASIRRRPWTTAAAAGVALLLLVAVAPRLLLLADWGGTLQKFLAMAGWASAAVLVWRLPLRGWRAAAAAAVGVAVLAAASTAMMAARAGGAPARDDQRVDVALAVDRYATFDASLTVLLDLLRPVVSDAAFYDDLREAGDVTEDRTLPPVRLALAEPLRPPAARPPNIIIVVVDSLRPDYLSAYNTAVTFTPAIGAFARDSIVMRRAFTQYAGTALSEPAIWAGALIQRAMYVQPFSAVDNLERLSIAGGYRRYMSVDEILSLILGDWSGVTRLDSHLAHPERKDEMYKFDLCATVDEFAQRLDRDASTKPLFLYTQPQNLHIRVLAGDAYPRDERVAIGASSFFAPAVAALRRVDGCFGRLVADLQARGLYDDSIIVLTSDHGDSYGEGGRWAHAFYMAPETLRIPLVVHVPPKYLAGRTWDPNEVAALTDLTPTLYDLLGYRPATGDLVGRTMFPRVGEPRSDRSRLFVQSSYSRVFGLLGGDAAWLYVADANHHREELYDVAGGAPFGQSVPPADRPKYRKWLRESLGRLDRFYGRPTSK